MRWLRRRGCDITHRAPHGGQPIPAHEHFDYVIVYGGAESVLDAHAYLEDEKEWIRARVESARPLLGICLGAQLIASALGGRVSPLACGTAEIGYRTVYPLPAADNPLSRPLQVFQWHRDGFELPAAAEPLATGELFPNQAFRVGRKIIGLQFHPEANSSIIRRWQLDAPDHLRRPGADPATVIERDGVRFARGVSRWLSGFLEQWTLGS